MNVEFRNHFYGPLKAIGNLWLLRVLFEAIVQPRRGVAALLKYFEQDWTLSRYISYARTTATEEGAPTYSGIGSYLWPLTVHSVTLAQASCQELHDEFEQAMEGLAEFRAIGDESLFGHPWSLFVAWNGTRSYPLHQHGNLNENLITVLSGSKRVLVFPPSEDIRLWERPELQLSEYGDRVFMADPETQHGVRGAAVTVSAGEMVYLPSNSIHLLENIGDTISVHEHLSPFIDSHIEERTARGVWRSGYLRPWLSRVAESFAQGSILFDR